MAEVTTDWVDGWEVHYRADGGYAVYDEHGMVAGPFGTRSAAVQAALLLLKRMAGVKQETSYPPTR